jgi:hypothetical protein
MFKLRDSGKTNSGDVLFIPSRGSQERDQVVVINSAPGSNQRPTPRQQPTANYRHRQHRQHHQHRLSCITMSPNFDGQPEPAQSRLTYIKGNGQMLGIGNAL